LYLDRVFPPVSLSRKCGPFGRCGRTRSRRTARAPHISSRKTTLGARFLSRRLRQRSTSSRTGSCRWE
jgi:hypothetical protein